MAFAGTHSEQCVGIIVGGAGTDMASSSLGLAIMGILYRLIPKKTLACMIKDSADSWPLYSTVSEELMEEVKKILGSFILFVTNPLFLVLVLPAPGCLLPSMERN
jgi:hypothetical protein